MITTNVPDPAVRRAKVFLGGHSLGGFLTAAFAGWDFDGDPDTIEDAGFRNCAGFVALDTVIKSMNEMLDPFLNMLPQGLHDGLNFMTENSYKDFVDGLRSGAAARLLPLPAITPEGFMLLELMGMEADWAPDQQSTLMQRTPYSTDVDFLTKLLQSKDLENFLTHLPSVKDFRYTSEALLGGLIDDNFMPISLIQASLGFMNGGPMQKKDFPLPSDLANIPGLSELLGSLISVKDLYVPGDAGASYNELGKGPLYHWTNFDEISTGADSACKDTTGQVTYTQQGVLANPGDSGYSLRLLSAMLKRNPAGVDAWVMRAGIYFQSGVYCEAAADCTSAIRLDAERVDAYLLRGRCYLKLGDTRGAEAGFRKVLELDPGNQAAQAELDKL